MSGFYKNIKNLIKKKKIAEAKEDLLVFLGENSNDVAAISLYLECLLAQSEFTEIDDFISSLNDEIKSNKEIVSIIKK